MKKELNIYDVISIKAEIETYKGFDNKNRYRKIISIMSEDGNIFMINLSSKNVNNLEELYIGVDKK